MIGDADELSAGEKLRLAFELHELGVKVMRQQLRRRHPSENDEELESRLLSWLHERPGAELGDAVGRLRAVPEIPH